MKDDHERIVSENIESVHRYIGEELKDIKDRTNFQGSYLFYLMNFSNTIKAVEEYVNSEPLKFKHYSEEEINNFSFDQIEKLLFAPKQKSTSPTEATSPTSNSIVDETVLATKGIIADVISPVLNFTLGTEIELSPEIVTSNYGKATAGIRETISSLKNNDSVIEAVAVARIALGNIVNKATWVAIGIEPIPDPKWLKNTESYKYSCKVVDKAADYLGPDIIELLKKTKLANEDQTKLYSSKSKKIVGLVLAGLAARKGGEMLPVAFAAAKVTYSTYFDYLANETTKAILDEKAHLEKYIDAKNRINFILDRNPQLERILGIEKEESITNDLDGKLAKIYADNPALKKFFQADQQVFADEKEKVIFVQVLENLVKTNESLQGDYKIWQAGDIDIPEKRIKIAKMHFARIYKDKFKRYQEPKQAEVLSSVGMAVKRKLVDALTSLYSAIESGGEEKDIIALTYTLTSVFTGQVGKAFLNETKQMKNLAEIATLKMDVPEYGGEQKAIGTYKHDLANMAFNKQVEATTLERMAKKELSVSDEDIQDLYHYIKAEVEEDLKKNPLFSESILTPTIATKLYDMGAGLLNSLNPWGSKPAKVPKEKKVTKAKEPFEDMPLEKEVQILENGPVGLEAPSKILQDLIPSDLRERIESFKIIDPLADRSSPISINADLSTPDSPATVMASFSPPITPGGKFKDIISADELVEIKKVTNIDNISEVRENDLSSKVNRRLKGLDRINSRN